MKVSFIVPARDEAATIGEVLELVVALPFEKQIIVVDDGSTDGTVEILHSNKVKLANTYLTPIISRSFLNSNRRLA